MVQHVKLDVWHLHSKTQMFTFNKTIHYRFFSMNVWKRERLRLQYQITGRSNSTFWRESRIHWIWPAILHFEIKTLWCIFMDSIVNYSIHQYIYYDALHGNKWSFHISSYVASWAAEEMLWKEVHWFVFPQIRVILIV